MYLLVLETFFSSRERKDKFIVVAKGAFQNGKSAHRKPTSLLSALSGNPHMTPVSFLAVQLFIIKNVTLARRKFK